jgi:uncharacterized membrane protein YagU involved in acid resistance
MNRSAVLAFVYGGFVAGTVDIFAPALIYMVTPMRILQAIARGVLGSASFEMGVTSAALGLVLQWFMSILIAAIFVFVATRMRVLVQRWLAAGIAYGVVVFVVMNYVVVPLSAVGKFPTFTTLTFTLNLLAMLLFGLIVSWFAQRFLSGVRTMLSAT